MRHFLCLCLAVAAPAQHLHADTPPTTAEVLAKVRQATGYERFQALPRGLLLQGKGKHFGLEGDYELLCNAQGHFVRTLNQRLGETVGFDGQNCWVVQHGQTSHLLELEDREIALAVLWVQTGHWLAEPSPFEISPQADKTTDTTVTLQLRLKHGRFKGLLTLDRATWLPRRLERMAPVGKMVWSFAEYRPALGMTLPHQITLERLGMRNTSTIQKVNEAPVFIRNPYAFLPTPPTDVAFDPMVAPELKVERSRSGHFLVQPRVNGEEIGWFIFDSGAGGMVIDKQAADKLKLEAFGEVPVVGIGGAQPGKYRQGATFQLGPMTLRDPVYVEINLQGVSLAMGKKISGICGAPLFRRAVVEVEVTTPRLALHDPEKYKLEGGSWQTLALKGNLPCTKAKWEGDHEALFRLDTGAANTVTFHTPAVEEWKLLEGRKTRTSASGGVGGMAAEKVGELEWFELGGHRFEKPRVAFSQAKTGAFTDEYIAGNVGNAFLSPFRLVFDYPHQRVAFVKLPGK